jgi:hypothetical protein
MPGGGRVGAGGVGVFDEADHGRPHRGDRGGERQVGEDPQPGGGGGPPRRAVAGEVEVGPPSAETDDNRGQGDGKSERAGRFGRESGHDAGDGLAVSHPVVAQFLAHGFAGAIRAWLGDPSITKDELVAAAVACAPAWWPAAASPLA